MNCSSSSSIRRFRLLLGVAALAMLGSCATLSEFLQAAFQKPRLDFKTARFANVSLEGLTLDTVWQVSNPNAVGLSLARADYKLSVEGKQVIAGAPPTGLQIPAQGAQELVFPASFKFLEIFPVAADLASKEFARYRVEGTVGVNTPIGVIALPLAYEDQFEVPKIPKFEFQPPRVSKIGLQGATVEFPLAITNRNSFSLPLQGLSGNLKIAGNSVGNLSTGDIGQLDGKGTRVVTLPLNVSLLGAAGAVVQALQGGSAPVQFDAQLQSGGSTVPIDVNQVLRFVR